MTTQSNQLITVEAPCDIDEGFAFDVIVEGRVFQIEVPAGGLKLGETFQAPLPDIGGDPLPSQAPTGRWKDSLFDCFKHGFMHPVLWNSFCCTQVAMAQIMSRLQLNWLGIKASPVDAGNAFRTIIIVIIAYYTLTILWSYIFPGDWYLEDDGGEYVHIDDPLGIVLLWALKAVFTIWSIVSLMFTRRALREKYEIPEERCHGFEDLVCSTFCSACAIAQMARHTADYGNYGAMCCTEDGVIENTPMDPIAVAMKVGPVKTVGADHSNPSLV